MPGLCRTDSVLLYGFLYKVAYGAFVYIFRKWNLYVPHIFPLPGEKVIGVVKVCALLKTDRHVFFGFLQVAEKIIY
jgi:hypothetical protein